MVESTIWPYHGVMGTGISKCQELQFKAGAGCSFLGPLYLRDALQRDRWNITFFRQVFKTKDVNNSKFQEAPETDQMY